MIGKNCKVNLGIPEGNIIKNQLVTVLTAQGDIFKNNICLSKKKKKKVSRDILEEGREDFEPTKLRDVIVHTPPSLVPSIVQEEIGSAIKSQFWAKLATTAKAKRTMNRFIRDQEKKRSRKNQTNNRIPKQTAPTNKKEEKKTRQVMPRDQVAKEKPKNRKDVKIRLKKMSTGLIW